MSRPSSQSLARVTKTVTEAVIHVCTRDKDVRNRIVAAGFDPTTIAAKLIDNLVDPNSPHNITMLLAQAPRTSTKRRKKGGLKDGA